MTPFPGFMDRGPGSFLWHILGFYEVRVFGTITAVCVVEDKWVRTARARHSFEALVFLVSLALAVATAFVHDEAALQVQYT